jgi:hypothetical protein
MLVRFGFPSKEFSLRRSLIGFRLVTGMDEKDEKESSMKQQEL